MSAERFSDARITIKAVWGDSPVGLTAMALLEGIDRTAVGNGAILSLPELLTIGGLQEMSADVVAALAILTQSEHAILAPRAVFRGPDGASHLITGDELRKVTREGKLTHPVSGEEVEGVAAMLFPAFELKTSAGV